jgi:hypothetical protein
MQSNSRIDRLHSLSETAVNGEVIHKMNLIGIVRVCGIQYFNVYRRYNSVYEIVVEDANGDFYLQRDGSLRDSIGAVLCLTHSQKYSMYTADLYSFRHGGTPPSHPAAPENMLWSTIQQEWYAIDLNLRGILEEYHAYMAQYYENQPVRDDNSDSSDACSDVSDSEDSEEFKDEYSDDDKEDYSDEVVSESEEEDAVKEEQDEDEEDYSDMPPLISEEEETSSTSDDNESDFIPQSVFFHYHFIPENICGKKRHVTEHESQSDSESDDDDYIILRNGTKYRKVE